MASDEPTVPCFTLSFRPNTALVSTVRRFVADLYRSGLGPELTSEVALATHELLENAVVHSRDGLTEVHVEIAPQDGGQSVCIQIRNEANPDDLEALRTAFEELRAATDPDAYYQTMMRRSVTRTDGSGLGLARIRAETRMEMALDLQGSKVCISARADTRTQEPVV